MLLLHDLNILSTEHLWKQLPLPFPLLCYQVQLRSSTPVKYTYLTGFSKCHNFNVKICPIYTFILLFHQHSWVLSVIKSNGGYTALITELFEKQRCRL